MTYVLCVIFDINIVMSFGQTAIGCKMIGSYCVFMHGEGKLMMNNYSCVWLKGGNLINCPYKSHRNRN